MSAATKVLFAISVLLVTSSCDADSKFVWEFDAGRRVISAAISTDINAIALLTERDVQVIDAKSGKWLKQIKAGDMGRFADSPSEVNDIACANSICWIAGGNHMTGYLARVNIVADENDFIESSLFAVIMSVDIGANNTVVTGHGSEVVTIWDAKSMRPIREAQLSLGGEVYATHYDGKRYLLGNADGELAIWDGKSSAFVKRFVVESATEDSGPRWISAITVANGFIVIIGYDYLDLINASNLADKRQVELNGAHASSCDGASKDHVVWCGLSDGRLISVGLDGKVRTAKVVHDGDISFVKVLGGLVVTAGKDGKVRASKMDDLLISKEAVK